MKHRHVFRTDDIAQASHAVRAAIDRGTPDDDVYLVARSDIEIRQVHNRRKMADSDFIPAAMRGAALGAVIGLVVAIGIALLWKTGLGVVLLGAGLGAAVGGLASSLVGAAIPDPVRRRFEKEIDAGNILLVVDVEESALPGMLDAVQATGAVKLPYDAPSAMT